MTIQQFETMLRESGIDDATVKALVANEKVAAKAGALKQADEYQTIEQRAAKLEADLAKAKSYEDWYSKNYATVQKLQQDVTKYAERYGSLDEPTQQQQQQVALKPDDIRKMIAEQAQELFQKTYAPQVVALTTGIGGVVEKHMRRGRKHEIDWKKLDELAATTNGDINAAYDQWDRPNSEKDAADAEDKRVEAKVKERLAAMGAQANFPAGADAHPTSRSPLSRDEGPKAYDRSKLLETFTSGEYKGWGTTQ